MIETEFVAPAQKDEGTVFDSVPGIVFDNRTRYSAIHFNTVDQHDQAFHVFVVKQAFEIAPADGNGISQLKSASRVASLDFEDRYFDGDIDGSVVYESDLAPFKPKCDILIKGSAYAPEGRPVTQLTVRAKLQRRSEVLIDKTLIVVGDRSYKRLGKVARAAATLEQASSLGLYRSVPWTATESTSFTSLPIKYEFSIGGAARISKTDPAAALVPNEYRIAGAASDAAHQVCETNPVGRGFAPLWYLTASGRTELPAPRIFYPGELLNVERFWDAVNGKALPRPAGLGAVGRAWLPRRLLAGNFLDKDSWGEDEVPRLPEDFDYRYWNCAPEDQQCSYLRFGEIFTLENLFRPGRATGGVVRFSLPQQAVFLMAGNAGGEVRYLNLHVDTVLIDTDLSRVELVWRGLLEADGRFRDVRLMQVDRAAQIERLDAAEALGIVQVKSAPCRKD